MCDQRVVLRAEDDVVETRDIGRQRDSRLVELGSRRELDRSYTLFRRRLVQEAQLRPTEPSLASEKNEGLGYQRLRVREIGEVV